MTTAPSVSDNVTSRFKILETPTLSPGHCAVCGAVDRPVIDFGLNIQRYGAIMLCEFCVCEAAERVGMVRPETLEDSKMQTGQSIDDYLAQNNLKVISNGFYDSIASVVGFFSADSVLHSRSLHSDFTTANEDDGEAIPGQLQLVLGDDEPTGKKPKRNAEAFDL